jgi:hypothetical protein
MTVENKDKTIHLQTMKGCDMIMKNSLARKTLDNITCVLITFPNFESVYNKTPVHCDINNIDQYYCQTDPGFNNAFVKYKEISPRLETLKKNNIAKDVHRLNNVNYQYLSKNMKKLNL